MIRKVNLEIGLSKNFNTVKMTISDEPIEFETEEQFDVKIKDIYAKLKSHVDHQHTLI